MRKHIQWKLHEMADVITIFALGHARSVPALKFMFGIGNLLDRVAAIIGRACK